MRRLGAIIAFAFILGVGGDASAQAPMPACTLEGRHPPAADITKLRTAVEGGFLFQTLQHRVGAPLSCRVVDLEPPNVSIVWSFAKEAAFTVDSSPGAGMVRHTAVMPGLSNGEALGLLKAGEKRFASPDGCGIDWSTPVRETKSAWIAGGTNDVVYLGKFCNCQARITYRGQNVIGLTMGLAC
ncbi:MAG: hypothetical protein JOY64_17125 [Alphaproteobacteria bacterium]|nr:hypothetical protein [Alphaproteobacteria bacterium]